MPVRRHTNARVRRWLLACFAVLMLAPLNAAASTTIDFRGTYVGTSEAGGSSYSGQTVVETEDCAAGTWSGTSTGGGYTVDDTGTIDGDTVTTHQDYRDSSYTADSTGTLSTDSEGRLRWAGTFTDSNGTTGSFDTTRVQRGPDDGGCSGGGTNPPPPPPDGKRSTATQVICTYSFLLSVDTCTATVGSADPVDDPSVPTGTVSFVSPFGLFSYGSSCNLKQTPGSPNVATCSVVYQPPDAHLPTITATYNGDGKHASSSGKTKYIFPSRAATYETPAKAQPQNYPNEIVLSTPVPVDGTAVQACVTTTTAASRASAAQTRYLPAPSAPLPLPELNRLTAQIGTLLGRADFVNSLALQGQADELAARILAGLAPGGDERAEQIRMPFMKSLGNDILKMVGMELGKLGSALTPLADTYVDTVMNSMPLDPEARAADLQTKETKDLLEVVRKIAEAQRRVCTPAAGLRRVATASAKPQRPARKDTILATKTRKDVKAGKLELHLRLNHRLVTKLTRHRKSIRVAVRINLLMPSSLLPHGYPRGVDELITLRRAPKKHRH
jgi:hypothetical protein